jgi:dUTP pyrophosphatase
MSRRPISPVRIGVQRLPHSVGLPLPVYQSAEAAGLDLLAAVPENEPIKLKPRGRVLVPTGLVLQLPSGTEAQVRPRSGLALKHGVTVLNAPGTIDSDYRGELMVLLVNHGTVAFEIRRGERIAQLVVQAVARARLVEVDEVLPTKRGKGGFGSTGAASLPVPADPRRVPATKKASKVSAERRKRNMRPARGR